MPRAAEEARFLRAFQSAPAGEGGRCYVCQHCGAEIEEFQSAPAGEGGRCLTLGWDRTLNEQFQSAPAGEGGRCPPLSSFATMIGCFNPRPPVKAGDAAMDIAEEVARAVSIRARR